MFNNVDLFGATNDAQSFIKNSYKVKRNGNFFFNKYSIYTGDKMTSPIFEGNKKSCMKVLRIVIASGILGVFTLKDNIICDAALNTVKK